jgi:peptidyl-dipeptidase A
MTIKLFALVPVLMLCLTSATAQLSPADDQCAALCNEYQAHYQPLFIELQKAWWDANITGTDAAYARKQATERGFVDLHSDKAFFARVKSLHDAGSVKDATLARQLDVMYRAFLEGQADPQIQKQIIALQNEAEQAVNTARPKVGQRTLHENDIRDLLAQSTDSTEVEAAWKAFMDMRAPLAERLRALARLRNQVAKMLGFRDYYALSLKLQEIDEAEFVKLFDELDELTRARFAQVKTEIDAARAARFHIVAADLRPWHYGDFFFQEAPGSSQAGLEQVYAGGDPVALVKKYYAGLGLPVEDIVARSDLLAKPGKCPNGFGVDMDRAGDVRVIANVKPDLYWTGTLLHEAGHATYYKYIRPDVPFLLHDDHPLLTEGIAEMFEALARNEAFLAQVVGLPPERAAALGAEGRAALRAQRLIFCRWSEVMVQFERGLYGDPEQDLAKLWTDLRQRYQLLSPPGATPRPDFAAKFHLITNPVYYHSYMIGELFAAQVRHHLRDKVLHLKPGDDSELCGRPEAGQFLSTSVFGPGNSYPWQELIRRATGEPLTARWFAMDVK